MTMPQHELNRLERMSRDQERADKARADARAAELKADFEEQISATYSFDQDEVWKEANKLAEEAVRNASRVIADRCQQLGIPKDFAPGLNLSWYGHGQNAMKDRRDELRKAACARIDALAKSAKAQIGMAASQCRVRLLSGSLESDDAKAFLASMPRPDDLMPKLALEEMEHTRRKRWMLE